jgi:hypothetical protein
MPVARLARELTRSELSGPLNLDLKAIYDTFLSVIGVTPTQLFWLSHKGKARPH